MLEFIVSLSPSQQFAIGFFFALAIGLVIIAIFDLMDWM